MTQTSQPTPTDYDKTQPLFNLPSYNVVTTNQT